ncbi:MAG: allantoinase AllB [Polyangiaceae bacterium]|nr:allantoinase AllB [Polyangiaceae bacterium]
MTQDNSFRFVYAKIPTQSGPREASVTVIGGQIACVDGPGGSHCRDVDIAGAWLLPGAIDGHVHFDDPGFTHREDFASGTRAAAAGGVTTVVDMPCTSIPPVTDGGSFDNKLAEISSKAYVDFKLWGGVRGNDFQDVGADADFGTHRLDELRDRGVRSIKTYLVSGMDTFADLTQEQLLHVLVEANRRGMLVGVHAEDKQRVIQGVREHADDLTDPLAYARSRDADAEAAGVATCVELAARTGASLHVVHLACAKGVNLIREAKACGVPISTETCPHYLAFTEHDLARLGGLLKTAPVVKKNEDRDALWAGIADGTIDMIATDHAPGEYPREKTTGSIWTDYGGVPGVELLLSYVMSAGVSTGRISLSRAVEVLCEAPARIHSLPAKGRLEPGADADLVVFDPESVWTVRAAELHTRQKYTPFEGMEMRGRVCSTYVRGVQVYDAARGIVGVPRGRLVAI